MGQRTGRGSPGVSFSQTIVAPRNLSFGFEKYVVLFVTQVSTCSTLVHMCLKRPCRFYLLSAEVLSGGKALLRVAVTPPTESCVALCLLKAPRGVGGGPEPRVKLCGAVGGSPHTALPRAPRGIWGPHEALHRENRGVRGQCCTPNSGH